MKIYEISKLLDEIAPYKTAYDFDNVGLLVGDREQRVDKIMVALDATTEVVQQAIEQKVQLLITHHPLIFKGMKNITADTASGKLIMQLIKHNIALIAMHTNLDIAQGGVNDCLAGLLGLKNIRTITEKHTQTFAKLSVFVPSTHTQLIIDELDKLHLRIFGNYESCSFTTPGTGRFKPLSGSYPFVGKQQELCAVAEDKVEFLLDKKCVDKVVTALKSVHPYEQMAYEVQDVLEPNTSQGILRMGDLSEAYVAKDFAGFVKRCMKVDYVLFTCPEKVITKVAVCGGSGAEYMLAARQAGADALLTGELKYHEAQAAEEADICVLAIGHQESEQPIVKYFAERLQTLLAANNIEIVVAEQKKTIYCV